MSKHTIIELRELDQDGESIDCASFDTMADAKAQLPELRGATVAWVMERRTIYSSTGKSDRYELLATFGNAEALRAGGWVKEVAS